MPTFSREQRVAIAVGIPVAALLLFLWFRRRHRRKSVSEHDASEDAEENEFASGCETTIEVKLPQAAVGAVIGKGGANIKRICKETGARLDLVDNGEDSTRQSAERTMLVRGEREKAKRAELMLLNIVKEQPVIVTEEMFVPQTACGRIIGKAGQNIRDLSRVSGAKITIERTEDRNNSALRMCHITGTAEQIRDAKGLLNEKIAEDKEMRSKRAGTRKYPSATSSQAWLPSGNSFFKVFVSAMENPGHFWVQPITSDSSGLEQLTAELNLLYGGSASHAVLNSFSVGDLCCAPFQFDNHWYRAEVLEVCDDGMVDLYYVDYGDTGKVAKDNLRELRHEHLKLPFQAVECSLASVRPASGAWSNEACDQFEQLTHCAEWTVILARVVKYCGTVPCLQLVDTSSETDLNINEEMVSLCYGLHDGDFPSSPPPGPRLKNLVGPADVSGIRTDSQPQDHHDEVIPHQISEVHQSPQNIDLSCSSQEPGAEETDGERAQDTTDSSLRGPIKPNSPVKTALLKRTSRDYINVQAQAANVLAEAPSADWGRAHVGVVREEVEEGVEPTLDKRQQSSAERREPITVATASASESRVHSEPRGPGAQPSQHVTHSQEHFVSSVTFMPHGSQEVSLRVRSNEGAQTAAKQPGQQYRVTRSVARQQDRSYAVESMTRHVTEPASVAHFDQERPPAMSEYRVTFERSNENFVVPEADGNLFQYQEPFTATDDKQPIPESTMGRHVAAALPNTACARVEACESGDMSPSGSLLNISFNTVIDEEEEEEGDEDGKAREEEQQRQGSADVSDESDLESFASTRDYVTSDTDTAGYVTARVGSSSASQEYLSLDTDTDTLDFESAREDATPVNSDDDEDDGSPETPTAQRGTLKDFESTAQQGRLDAQTVLLDAAVASNSELGYRADTEEGLAPEKAQHDTRM